MKQLQTGVALGCTLGVVALFLWLGLGEGDVTVTPSADAPQTVPSPTSGGPRVPSGPDGAPSPLRVNAERAAGEGSIRVFPVAAPLGPHSAVSVQVVQVEPQMVLWRGNTCAAEPAVITVPSGRPIRVVAVTSSSTPRRVKEVSVAAGQCLDVDLDFSSVVECRFRVLDWNSEMAGARVAIEFRDAAGKDAGTDTHVLADSFGQFSVAGDSSAFVRLEMFGMPLWGIGADRCDTFALADASHDVRLAERFTLLSCGAMPPVFAQAAGDIRVFDRSTLVLRESEILGDIVVFDLHANLSIVPKANIRYGQTMMVALERSTLDLTVDVGRDTDLGLLLYGPEPRGRSRQVFLRSDPRAMRSNVTRKRASFGPLVPGYYSLWWTRGESTSPAKPQFYVGYEARRVEVIVPQAEAQRVCFSEWPAILAHVGVEIAELNLDDVAYRPDATGGFEFASWSSTGYSTRVRLGCAAFDFFSITAQVNREGQPPPRLCLNPHTQPIEIRLASVFGGRARMAAPSGRYLEAAGDGGFKLYGLDGQRLRAPIIETHEGLARLVAVADFVVEARRSRYDVPSAGRWVDIQFDRCWRGADLLASAEGWTLHLGNVGSGGGLQIWLPRYPLRVYLRRHLFGEVVLELDANQATAVAAPK